MEGMFWLDNREPVAVRSDEIDELAPPLIPAVRTAPVIRLAVFADFFLFGIQPDIADTTAFHAIHTYLLKGERTILPAAWF